MTEVQTLDYYVLKALDFFEEMGDYKLLLPKSNHTLVAGSQSGYLTGRIVYRFAGRAFSHAPEVLAQHEIDSKSEILDDVTIVSATGSRNVIPIAEYALNKGLKVNVVTCTENSPVKTNFPAINDIIVPTLEEPEPPTVNTATYGGMIQGVTHENIPRISREVEALNDKLPKGGYENYGAFTVVLPDRMPEVAGMVDWKLRGEKIGRCIGSTAITLTDFMSAAITDAKEKYELYIALGLSGEEREVFDQVLEHIPMDRKHYININKPDDFGPLGYLTLGYFVVGQIQKNYPGFQNNILDYKRETTGWEWINPIKEKS